MWGASGGDIGSYTGGKGAYTAGNISLQRGTPLYLYIGGAGSNTVIGGYNGGGDLAAAQNQYGSSGGGANNRNRTDRTYKYGAGNGGYGGALKGGDGQSVNYQASEGIPSYNQHIIGTGGTQTAGGITIAYDSNNQIIATPDRGLFGKAISASEVNTQSGAGSGYYAGGRGAHAGAGGGSSFISGYPGCDAIEDSSTGNKIIHTGKPEHYSGYVFIDSTMIAGNQEMPTHDGSQTMIGNAGNGYARITYLGN